MRNKLGSKKGESLAETMVAMLLVAMSLTILAGGIVTAARINGSTGKNSEEAVVVNDETGGDINVVISVVRGEGEHATKDPVSSIPIKLHQTEKGFFYYGN